MRFAQDDSFGFCLPYSIVHFNFHERSELTSIFTSDFTSIFTSIFTSDFTSESSVVYFSSKAAAHHRYGACP